MTAARFRSLPLSRRGACSASSEAGEGREDSDSGEGVHALPGAPPSPGDHIVTRSVTPSKHALQTVLETETKGWGPLDPRYENLPRFSNGSSRFRSRLSDLGALAWCWNTVQSSIAVVLVRSSPWVRAVTIGRPPYPPCGALSGHFRAIKRNNQRSVPA
jgi:hypothetical protein